MRKVKAYGEIIEIPDHRIFWLSRIVYSSAFELSIAFVILLNAISLGLLTILAFQRQLVSPLKDLTSTPCMFTQRN